MFSDNHKISLRQMQALFCFYFLGTASLFLPAELAEGSGRACWLVMLIGGLLAAFFSLVLTYLGKKEPTWTVVEWLRNTFGGVLGSVLAVFIAGKIAVDAMLEVRIFTEILRSTMLPHTPLWLMVGTLLALSAFGVARGIEGQARGAEILFFFVFPPFVLLLFAVALTAGEAYFLPVQLPKLDGLRRGAAYVQPLFQAMIFLLFLPPFLEKPEKGQKSLFAVCLLTTFLMTAATFLCLTVYGAESLSHKISLRYRSWSVCGFPAFFWADRTSFCCGSGWFPPFYMCLGRCFSAVSAVCVCAAKVDRDGGTGCCCGCLCCLSVL